MLQVKFLYFDASLLECNLSNDCNEANKNICSGNMCVCNSGFVLDVASNMCVCNPPLVERNGICCNEIKININNKCVLGKYFNIVYLVKIFLLYNWKYIIMSTMHNFKAKIQAL